jgi:histidine triad (HIT) family protein
MQYDANNIFAKILRGEIPCHKIMENDDCIAFMDIMPQTPGHCLVVPRAASRNLFDADPGVLSRTIASVQTIARAAVQAMSADGCRIVQFNEAAAGQTVFHLHFHVMPIAEGQAILPHAGAVADHTELAAQAKRIREAIQL